MTNENLLNRLKQAVMQEREATALVLRYLRKVEEQKVYLDEGYTSFFVFCTGYLNYSEGEAHVRIQAMRLMRVIPNVERKVEEGALSLTVAAKAQGAFRRHRVEAERQAEILVALDGSSARDAERIPAREFPEAAKPDRTRPINETQTEIRFTAGAALLAKLNRLKELLAHKNYSGRYELLFEELADLALKKLEPKSDAPLLEAPQVKRTRYIPKSTRRSILARESCEYVSPSGKRCGSRHGVQMDHRINFSEGGSNTPENLQLLCGAHNRWKYRTSR